MDLELMIASLPKLLSAAGITLKLLSVSLIIGLFIGLIFAILRLKKNTILKINHQKKVNKSYTTGTVVSFLQNTKP